MLKAASIILIVVALCAVIIGIVYVARGTLMDYHEEFLGMTLEDIRDFNPKLAALATIFIRLAGILFISAGTLLLAVIYFGLRKAERWAWWATLVGMGVLHAPLVAITNPVRGPPWTFAIVSLLVFVTAIGLAARELFRQVPERPTTRTQSS